jgi:hypothetical protein
MSIAHKPASSGITNLQTLAADRAARALAVNDGLAEAHAAATHKPHTEPVSVVHSAVNSAEIVNITEASVEAAIVKHREEEAPRPNMAPIIQTRVASVGTGSTRSVPHAPFVPNQPKPVKQSSVGGGQAKRPTPVKPVTTPTVTAPATIKPGAVTAASITAAIAASRPAAPVPRVMATKKK